MAVDDLVKKLCSEADDFSISLNIMDVKGIINIRKKDMLLNPVYLEEFPETFLHEMCHYHFGKYGGNNEEVIVEDIAMVLLKNQDNRGYVEDYLNHRNIYKA